MGDERKSGMRVGESAEDVKGETNEAQGKSIWDKRKTRTNKSVCKRLSGLEVKRSGIRRKSNPSFRIEITHMRKINVYLNEDSESSYIIRMARSKYQLREA